jgi:DNA-binding IclR family transcriptional regulator
VRSPKGKKQIKLNALMLAMLLEELVAGPCTAQALAEHTGLGLITIQRFFRALKARDLIHIAGWEKDVNGRYVIRVFGFGSGTDVRCPKKRRTVTQREYRQRQARGQGLSNPFAGLGA